MTDEVDRGRRLERRAWQDPRLLAGTALMAVAVLAGSWVTSSGESTVAVAVATHDLRAGAAVSGRDVEVRRVHFEDVGAADRYLASGSEVAAGSVLDRPVGEGELVPRAALRRDDGPAVQEVPFSVAVDDVPATVTAGSVVDVWVVADDQGPDPARAVLTGVTVLRVGGGGDSLAPTATRQVIVTVPDGRRGRLGQALALAASGRVVITRRS